MTNYIESIPKEMLKQIIDDDSFESFKLVNKNFKQIIEEFELVNARILTFTKGMIIKYISKLPENFSIYLLSDGILLLLRFTKVSYEMYSTITSMPCMNQQGIFLTKSAESQFSFFEYPYTFEFVSQSKITNNRCEYNTSQTIFIPTRSLIKSFFQNHPLAIENVDQSAIENIDDPPVINNGDNPLAINNDNKISIKNVDNAFVERSVNATWNHYIKFLNNELDSERLGELMHDLEILSKSDRYSY
jgi:hypothetical protein